MLCLRMHGIELLSVFVCTLGGLASGADAGDAVTLFDGKSLAGWVIREPQQRNKWKTGDARLDPGDPTGLAVSTTNQAVGHLINDTAWRKGSKEPRDVDIYTAQTFGDCTICLEFLLPRGANSGVYVMGEYELQLKDSYGQNDLTFQDLGAIYKVAAARVNAARKPGEWQSLRIEFLAPRFEGGTKTANARFVKVVLNGQVIQENVELNDVTPGGLTKQEVPAGPLMLQGDHGPVAFRNIRVTFPEPR